LGTNAEVEEDWENCFGTLGGGKRASSDLLKNRKLIGLNAKRKREKPNCQRTLLVPGGGLWTQIGNGWTQGERKYRAWGGGKFWNYAEGKVGWDQGGREEKKLRGKGKGVYSQCKTKRDTPGTTTNINKQDTKGSGVVKKGKNRKIRVENGKRRMEGDEEEQ